MRTPDQACTRELGELRTWGAAVGVGIAELGTAAAIEPADAQAIVALGGDGTILTALRYAAPLGVPVLGVNFGHVGFLADVDRAGLPKALEAISGNGATVEERSAIQLTAPGIDTLAANDIGLARRYGSGPARVALTLKGTPLASLVGDGLVFASPGGSTAHNLNAGGPVLSPLLRALVLRTLNARAPMPGRARAPRGGAGHRPQRGRRAVAGRGGRRPRGRRDPGGRGGHGPRRRGERAPAAHAGAALLRRARRAARAALSRQRGGRETDPSQ